ncbi:pyridoxal-phosphate dependent enzyme [Actinoplanes couchii]|uniref:Serine/threonine dehydratase n=1 Tax=Actinoplanes couchii TaxID=403638 RepID=A0ABQ3XH98_9ACTN|nr:pyridoxal-phosphate dependent enzyme [Actinoplanes couchii]MDR6320631.1 threonine dehydratase [Actinoplanes couchii]GID57883.1 serine/threonine dehydratase [Actinoplanes couchii]
MVTLQDVQDAAARLDGIAHRTPVIRSRTLDALAGASVFLKAENFQRGGAFKFRGAYNTAAQLSPDQLARGIVAFSSGNHAQAVAIAARELGSSAVIVMPSDSPKVKIEAVRGYGGEIVLYDRYTDDRLAITGELAASRGLALIPPYDHPDVIAGQGTATLELLDEVGPVDTLIAPIGGGGLIAGSALAAPGARVIGVEPVAGDDTRRSLAAGVQVRIEVPRTIADGLTVATPGDITFPLNQRLVDEVILVSDDELRDAMRFALDRLKIVLEPSGAAGLAVLLTGRLPSTASRVGVILTGGNVGAARLAALLA